LNSLIGVTVKMSENCRTVSANLSFLGLLTRYRAIYSNPYGGELCCCTPDGSDSSLPTTSLSSAAAGTTTLRLFGTAFDPYAVARFFDFLVVGLVTELVACALREGLEVRAGRRGGDWEAMGRIGTTITPLKGYTIKNTTTRRATVRLRRVDLLLILKVGRNPRKNEKSAEAHSFGNSSIEA
jgi:hypothetical protein